MDNLANHLLEKSEEAFILAVEIYNKPTIRYRVEGFAFFICNAWELMLKARLLETKGEAAIYYKNKPDRTISLEQCVKDIFTNRNDPLRINIERIIDLRNISTHFVTEEFEQIYVPLFQSCVLNFSNKMLEFFDRDIAEKIPSNFLTLSIKLSDITESEIRARYPRQIADKIIKSRSDVQACAPLAGNEKYAIFIRHDFYITKKEKEATVKMGIVKDKENAAYILTKIQDPQNAYPYTRNRALEIINNIIRKEGIAFVNPTKEESDEKARRFNAFHFGLFVKFYNMKSDAKYCYAYKIGSQPQYSYSQRAIDFIVEEIKKDPGRVIRNLREGLSPK